MEKRYTKRYGFKEPNVERLKELASFVQDPSDFRKSHGKLLPILNTHVDEGLLKTLVQFYDPVYRCFTFPDTSWYQPLKNMPIFWVFLCLKKYLSMVWKPFLSHKSFQQ